MSSLTTQYLTINQRIYSTFPDNNEFRHVVSKGQDIHIGLLIIFCHSPTLKTQSIRTHVFSVNDVTLVKNGRMSHAGLCILHLSAVLSFRRT